MCELSKNMLEFYHSFAEKHHCSDEDVQASLCPFCFHVWALSANMESLLHPGSLRDEWLECGGPRSQGLGHRVTEPVGSLTCRLSVHCDGLLSNVL